TIYAEVQRRYVEPLSDYARQFLWQMFISSRRRHTRSKRDWSSDVCSSDLDRDRTVSRRSEPSSRAALMGEQPNPWDRLQPQDAMSRHRGAKPPRRCELLGEISLLSPG